MPAGSRRPHLLRRVRPSLDGQGRVRVFSGALAAAGLLLYAFNGTRDHVVIDSPIEWWMLAVGFGVAEVFVVHIQLRREHHSFSLSEVPLVLGLFYVAPVWVLPARLLGSFAALWLHRRQPVTKLVFNLASFAFEVGVATLIFQALAADPDPLGWGGWLPALVATLAAAAASALNVTAVVRLFEGVPQPGSVTRVLVPVTFGAVMNTVLALIAVALVAVEPAAGWLVVCLVVVLFLVYGSYASLMRRHESLELLHAFTRNLGQSLQADAPVERLLDQLRQVVKAEVAELTVLHPGGGAIRTRLDVDDRTTTEHLGAGALAGPVWEAVLDADQPLRVGRDGLGGAPELAERGIEDALVAPLHADGRTVGHVLVGNRLGRVIGFDDADLRLFEAMANHASVALENSQLVDRLRQEAADKAHQAMHDALTGLPNRVLFQERVDEAVAGRAAGTSVGVLLIDLDRFKEVNDTLGHHNGDLLLEKVAARLKTSVRRDDLVARLGGDEFGVLLPEVSSSDAVVAAARALATILNTPVEVSDLTIDVGASIGVAVAPAHGEDASTLLQRADVAMYNAKAERTGVESYDAERDHYSPHRLSLAGELRAALDRGSLDVRYQLKADIASGVVVGAEALVRWDHPVRGLLLPDEFIPIAEHTGLVRRVSRFVIDDAVRACARWREAGHDMHVALNLSMRDLLDPDLPKAVADALVSYDLPPAALTLELTESVLMSDVAHATAALHELHRMGVLLSIDDFGVGYSSLAYLQQLPVQEIKIDKSFVEHLRSPGRLPLVKSIIDLAGNLGLRVVAEGIEDNVQWTRLADLGCDLGQGYWIAEPASADELDVQLAEGVRGMRPRPLGPTVVPIRGRQAAPPA